MVESLGEVPKSLQPILELQILQSGRLVSLILILGPGESSLGQSSGVIPLSILSIIRSFALPVRSERRLQAGAMAARFGGRGGARGVNRWG